MNYKVLIEKVDEDIVGVEVYSTHDEALIYYKRNTTEVLKGYKIEIVRTDDESKALRLAKSINKIFELGIRIAYDGV